MLKMQEVHNPHSCLNKARDDEGLFVLLARDEAAPEVIRYWTYLRAGGKPLPFIIPHAELSMKLKEALDCADEMERTRDRFKVPA